VYEPRKTRQVLGETGKVRQNSIDRYLVRKTYECILTSLLCKALELVVLAANLSMRPTLSTFLHIEEKNILGNSLKVSTRPEQLAKRLGWSPLTRFQ
jgi:hypothetical protein